VHDGLIFASLISFSPLKKKISFVFFFAAAESDLLGMIFFFFYVDKKLSVYAR